MLIVVNCLDLSEFSLIRIRETGASQPFSMHGMMRKYWNYTEKRWIVGKAHLGSVPDQDGLDNSFIGSPSSSTKVSILRHNNVPAATLLHTAAYMHAAHRLFHWKSCRGWQSLHHMPSFPDKRQKSNANLSWEDDMCHAYVSYIGVLYKTYAHSVHPASQEN